EREEQHHEVGGADEEDHPGAGGEQEGEELRDVVVAPGEIRVAAPGGDVLDREQRRREAQGAENDLPERGPAVAVEGARDDRVPVRAVDVEPDREHDPRRESRGGDAGRDRTAEGARHEHRAEERDERRPHQREHRPEAEPVDVRRVQAHLNWPLTVAAGLWPKKEWWLIPAGQAERKSSPATSGTTSASSPGRTSSASSATVDPRASCRTAEISRSMYMAASTIAPAPIADHHHARWNTPAR